MVGLTDGDGVGTLLGIGLGRELGDVVVVGLADGCCVVGAGVGRAVVGLSVGNSV